MKSIRVKNFRALEDTNEIEIKPLTIVLGKNSCGKSSLLRIFPLLKQTLETRTADYLLWYGPYVDFGGFEQTLNKKNPEGEISLAFTFIHHTESNKVISIEFSLLEDIMTYFKISFHGDLIQVYLKDQKVDKLIINKTEMTMRDMRLNRNYNDIIPNISSRFVEELSDKLKAYSWHIIKDNNRYETESEKKEYVDTMFQRALMSVDVLDDFFIKSRISRNVIDREKFKQLMTEDRHFRNSVICYKINDIITYCNMLFSLEMLNLSYVAPIRASAERYYRKQGLYIKDVDARGENVPHMLSTMDPKEQDAFSQWIYDNFNFRIKVKSSEGHLSVYILTGEETINIADTGFGYSQILPILLLLWKEKNRKGKKNRKNRISPIARYSLENLTNYINKLIIMEQPELHLHPQMQKQLISVIQKLVNNNLDITSKFIIETHSEVFVNYIGELISEGILDSSKVNVVLVESDGVYCSTVKTTHYSADGYLENWPIDFF